MTNTKKNNQREVYDINKIGKRIGIYTLQTINYGNKLQNYALQELLNNNNYLVETINREAAVHGVLMKNLLKAKALIRYVLKKDIRTSFYEFTTKYLEYAPENEYINQYFCSITNKRYDAVFVGSDQIWNTTFPDVNNNCFLPFELNRKIAFSASFGVDTIPYDQQLVDCLKDFKAISVREEAGAKIIKELTGRDATILVDPTMLLTKEEWRKVYKKPKGAKEGGYILTYFLSPKCDEAKNKLEEIRNGREVYELLNPNDNVAGTAGPSEFLWLIDHADLILTDSFHACVFSFLFDKPFVVYDRNWDGGNMNSRLETLLSKFHLERKYANSGLDNELLEHDYTEGYKQLELERKKAFEFLKDALED